MNTPVQDHLDRLTAAHPGDADGVGGLGVAVVMVDGHRYVSGSAAAVPLGSLTQPLLHALALEDLGPERVAERVGAAPLADEPHRVELEPGTGRAVNPLHDAGAVATAALVKGRGGRDRAGRLLQLAAALTGRESSPAESAVRAESRAQQHTRAAAWLLRSVGALDAEPEAVLEDIATLRAVPVTVEDLALAAATLAQGGVHPVSGDRVLSAETVRTVLSVLDSCGMPTRQAGWAHDVGQPGWASVRGGTVMVVVPGHLGLALQQTPADGEEGVPEAVTAALRSLVADFELHPTHVTGSPRSAFRTHYRLDQAPSGAVRSAAVFEALARHGDTVHVLELGGHLGFSQVDALAHVVEGLPAELQTLILDVRSVSSVSPSARTLVARWIAHALHEGLDIVLVDRDDAHTAGLLAAAEAAGVDLPDPRQEEERDLEAVREGAEFLFFDSRSRAIQWAEQRTLARHAPQLLPSTAAEAVVAPLLQHLSPEDAALLGSMMDERRYTDGQIIRRAGQPFGGIYIITSGRVELTGQGTNGRRTRRTVLTPGMTFGEMALGQLGRQPSTVRARGEVTARVLTAQVMYALQEGSPQLALKLWEALARDAFTALSQLVRETGALQD